MAAYPGIPEQAGNPGISRQAAYPGIPRQGAYPGIQGQGAYPGTSRQGAYPGIPRQGAYPGIPRQGAYPGIPRQAVNPDPSVVIPDTNPDSTEESEILIRFDPSYFKTVPGIVKIAQIGFSLLGFICIQVSFDRGSPRGKFYSWIAMIAISFSGILLALYVYHVVEKYQHKVPWLKIELGFCVLWTLFFLLASSLTIGQWGNNPFIAAGSIGYRATVAYGVDVYLKWGAVRRGSPAQAPRVEFQLPSADNIPVIAVIGSSTV